MGGESKHTDAAAQARFTDLTPAQQMLEIWLNTRETNGSVAALWERMSVIEPKVNKHDRYVYVVTALLTMLIVGTPFLLWVLNHVRWE